MTANARAVLALDVGDKRIGLAIAAWPARLPRPLTTLGMDDNFWPALKTIITNEGVDTLVVGWPRGLNGQSTDQTEATKHFADRLRKKYPALSLYKQDEAVTSRQAKQELDQRGKPYSKADVDALAATYILQDWLDQLKEPVG